MGFPPVSIVQMYMVIFRYYQLIVAGHDAPGVNSELKLITDACNLYSIGAFNNLIPQPCH